MSELKLTEIEAIRNMDGALNTAQELYEMLDMMGYEYEVIDMAEGSRVLCIQVAEPTEEDEDE